MENDLDNPTADLAQLVAWFEEAESITYESRLLMDRDVDFYDGKQLSDAELSALKARMQPAIVINQIKPEIDYLAGVEKSQRVDPKAYPRTPQDDPAAYAATQGLRFVMERERYDNARSLAWKGLLKSGLTAAKVGAKDGQLGRDPEIKVYSYDRYFYDPHSSDLDLEDKRYDGFVTWMDYDAAVTLYGEEHKDAFLTTMSGDGLGTHYDDKPKWAIWGDSKRKRLRMVEMYYKLRGVWHEAIFTKGGIISNRPSPYIDEMGNPENPIVAQAAYRDRDNNIYGQVREMVDPQSDYNKRRSKATHILNSRQVIADVGAVDDPNKARRDLAKPDAWIEKNPGKEINLNGNSGLEIGQFNLMQEAIGQLRSNSMKNGMIGGEGQSGRAIQANQQGAMLEAGDLLDNLRHFDMRVFEKVWNRIKQFWDGPRWIRITDDPESVKHLGINIPLNPMTGEPLTPQEQEMIKRQPPMIDEMGNPIDPMASLPVQNPVAEMNVDLRIEDAPDITSLQGEDFERFAGLVPQLAQLPPQWAKMLIELMPHSPGKEAAKAILEQLEQQPQPDPAAEEMKRLAMAKEAAEIEEINSDTLKNTADAYHKMGQVIPMPTPQSPQPQMMPQGVPQF